MRKKAKPPRPSETQVKAAIQKLLEYHGWHVDRKGQQPVTAKNGRKFFPKSYGKGAADLICSAPPSGKYIGIEVKRNEKAHKVWLAQNDWTKKSHRHAINQKRWGDSVRRAGGLYYCIWSVEQAERIVEEVK